MLDTITLLLIYGGKVTRNDMVGRLKMLGLDQCDFAAKLGVNVSTVRHWKVVPQYAAVLIETLELAKKLEDMR